MAPCGTARLSWTRSVSEKSFAESWDKSFAKLKAVAEAEALAHV